MKIVLSVIAGVIALLLVGYIFFFCGPFFFAERDIRPESIEHLRSHPILAKTPKDAAFNYFYYGLDPSGVPKENQLDIHISAPNIDKSVVTIIDRDCQDDSVEVTCDRFTLHREGEIWIPDRHQAAWQGRGRFGWTTSPTL